jgi:hypothetical protein
LCRANFGQAKRGQGLVHRAKAGIGAATAASRWTKLTGITRTWAGKTREELLEFGTCTIGTSHILFAAAKQFFKAMMAFFAGVLKDWHRQSNWLVNGFFLL